MKDNEILILIIVNTCLFGCIILLFLFSFLWRHRLRAINFGKSKNNQASLKSVAVAITDAMQELSSTKTGALIVLEKKSLLNDYYNVELDANVQPLMIVAIFNKQSPLHDGAIIIQNFRIRACSCYLPNSKSNLEARLGSRHRAALGITEVSDAMSIIVSESTGKISYFFNEKMNSLNDSTELVNIIINFYTDNKLV